MQFLVTNGARVGRARPSAAGRGMAPVDGRLSGSSSDVDGEAAAPEARAERRAGSASATATASDLAGCVSGVHKGKPTGDGSTGEPPDGDTRDGGKKGVAPWDRSGTTGARGQRKSAKPESGPGWGGEPPPAVVLAPREGPAGAAPTGATGAPFTGLSRAAAAVVPFNP